MTAESLLVLLFGMVAGFTLGYLTKWRTDRKLEHHGVKLADWDQPVDFKAEPQTAARIIRPEQFGS